MENRRLIFFFFPSFLSDIRGRYYVIYEHIRGSALCKGNSIGEQFMRTCTMWSPLCTTGILKREAFLSDRFMNGNGFITCARWKLFNPASPPPDSVSRKRSVKMSGTKRVLFRSCRDEIRLRVFVRRVKDMKKKKKKNKSTIIEIYQKFIYIKT